MRKTHRVILIDPEARSIRELESDGSLDSLHRLVGAASIDSFGIAAYDNGGQDMGWVDDEGLTRGKPVHAFLLPIAKDPIAGRCLIIGANRHGETSSARFPLALLRQDVSWLGPIRPEVTWDHTEHGSRAIVIYSRIKP
jgi:hypothetical protein